MRFLLPFFIVFAFPLFASATTFTPTTDSNSTGVFSVVVSDFTGGCCTFRAFDATGDYDAPVDFVWTYADNTISVDVSANPDSYGTYHVLNWNNEGSACITNYATCSATADNDASLTWSASGGGGGDPVVLGELTESEFGQVFIYSMYGILKILFWGVLLVMFVFMVLQSVFRMKI